MKTDDLPIDVWRIILRHLRNPVPPPLSRPARCALKQRHVTVCARVCKMFYDICKPLLYMIVVTDALPAFLLDFDTPSRRKLLAYTEHLYIEYCDKTFQPSYKDLLQGSDDAWNALTGFTPGSRQAAAVAMCGMELESLLLSIEPLVERETRNIFPRLTTVSVSLIYGVQDEVWTKYDDLMPPAYGESILNCANILWRGFINTSNVKHWCFRSCVGPLGLNPISGPEDRQGADNAAITTIHFNEKSEILCAAPGKKVRWVSDMSPTSSWHPLNMLLCKNTDTLAKVRSATADCAKVGPVDVDVYCSTSVLGTTCDHPRGPQPVKKASELGHKAKQSLSLAQQRGVADHFGQFWQKELRAHTGEDDHFQCYPSYDSPICEACGSGPPGL